MCFTIFLKEKEQGKWNYYGNDVQTNPCITSLLCAYDFLGAYRAPAPPQYFSTNKNGSVKTKVVASNPGGGGGGRCFHLWVYEDMSSLISVFCHFPFRDRVSFLKFLFEDFKREERRTVVFFQNTPPPPKKGQSQSP